MKRSSKLVLGTLTIVGAVFSGFLMAQTSRAGSAPVPGSAADPVVTQSYVDQKIQSLLSSGAGASNGGGSSSSTGGQSGFQVVDVPSGKTVVASTANGLEVIVRTGSVQAVAGTQGGLADLTSGSNLDAGAVTANHFMVLARNDGRGLKVTSADSFMLIRGSYSLQ